MPPARVFAAFADPAIKARWFGGPAEWQQGTPEHDFRIGGHEAASGGPLGDGTRLTITEHGAFLDGHDQPAAREHGTAELLDALGRELDPATAVG